MKQQKDGALGVRGDVETPTGTLTVRIRGI
jgi:hypothetical protein